MSQTKIIGRFNPGQTTLPHKRALANLRANPAQPKGDGAPITRDQLHDRTQKVTTIEEISEASEQAQ